MAKNNTFIFLLRIFVLFNLCNFYFSSVPCIAEEDPKFLFQEDHSVKNDEPLQNQKNNSIEKDEWLNSPPTRLELIIHLMNLHYEKKISISEKEIKKVLINTFEAPKKYGPSIFSSAFYDENSGCVNTLLTITNLGKPKQPMIKTCEYFLNSFFMMRSPYMNKTSINTNSKEYHESLDSYSIPCIADERVISENLINRVFLQSDYDGKKFNIECYTYANKKDTIKYRKDIYDYVKDLLELGKFIEEVYREQKK